MYPQATFASRIDFDKEPDAVHVTREVDGGLESLSVSLPAVITCDLRLNQPRFATLPNVMKARKKKIETIDVADLKVDVSSKMDLLNVSEPEKRPPGVFVDSVDELIHKLRSEAKVL